MVKLQERRDKLVQACRQVFPQVITPSSGFYMLVCYPDNFYLKRGQAFVNMMIYRYRILVLDGAFMGVSGWFRLSFTASDDMIDLAVSGIEKFATEYMAQEHELQRWIYGGVENTDKYTEETT
jgi:DNA-binding transcriptional MocR family regulator